MHTWHPRRCRRGLIVGGAWLLAAGSASASDVLTLPIIYAPPGTPALGGAMRLSSNPTISELDTFDLVPLYLYEGKRFYAHGTEFGAHLFRNDTFQLSALARYRFTRIEPGDDARLAGLEEREQALDGGVSAQVRGGWGQLQADWVTDLQDRHEGQEFNLTYRYRFERGDLLLSPFIGYSWQDSDLVGYYYGISPEEAGERLPEYDPGSAGNIVYGLNTWYRLSDHVFVFGNVGVTSFDNSIQRSPLVDTSGQFEAFIGSGYMFGNVRSADRTPAGREGEWSWRGNAGWLAQENIFPFLMAGDWKGSSRADTPIAGLTVGKLLNGGPRVDFYGKLALFRHFERDYQPDFWNYTAYIMAMAKGYLPWSDELAFRYGFGFGVSYAERVPTVEVIKQTSKDDNYARLLNYLEFQADVPLERFVEWKPLRNCFAGVTVVHRSGIFGTSDILGEVSGGSDWVTLHLECLR
jgi:outer membrane scaffolding protein for murein synthesis (MipA/OmpV family)